MSADDGWVAGAGVVRGDAEDEGCDDGVIEGPVSVVIEDWAVASSVHDDKSIRDGDGASGVDSTGSSGNT